MVQLMYSQFDSSQQITNPSAFRIQKAQYGIQINSDGELTIVQFPNDSSFSIDNPLNEDDSQEDQELLEDSDQYIFTPKEFEPNKEFMNCLNQYLKVGNILNKIKK
ncbi:unnamed protein product [Paramecium sonneborni]|uniref:Uncharacterized protein n=1 Tax=Paramecium sonneborni TaxID=65129 RepID=A0A8S1RER8_9CILI|nr:unnamed protein product [Paramecium sonneborni]